MKRITFLVARDVEGGVTLDLHAHNYDAPVAPYLASNNGKYYFGHEPVALGEIKDSAIVAELNEWLASTGR